MLMTTMRTFGNDFLSFMGIRADEQDEPENLGAIAAHQPSAGGYEEANIGAQEQHMINTPRGQVPGSMASPFARIALGYGQGDQTSSPFVMSVSQRRFYAQPEPSYVPPGGPDDDKNSDDGLYTAPPTKDPSQGRVPSYEPPAGSVMPRGRGRGAAGRRPPPMYSKEDGDVEMDDMNGEPNPRGRRQVKHSNLVVIVHRDGTRETVPADDPRVEQIQKKKGGGRPSTGMYAKDKNGDVMMVQNDQSRIQNARRREALEKALRPKPYFTLTVTILQIALFIFELAKSARMTAISFNFNLGNIWGFGGVNTNVIIELGGKYAELIVSANQWWRFITPIFLHVSLPHIIFNLLSQVKVGIDLERSFGSIRIGLLYILCGVGGNLLSCCFLYDQIQAGASGAIFGQVGMMLVDVFVNWKLLQRPVCNLVIMIIVILICVFSGMMPGVDNFAHVGGLVVGIVGGFAFMPRLVNKKGRWTRLIVVAITFPLLIALFAGLFSLFYGYVAEGNNIDCEWCEQINCASALLGEDWCKRSTIF